MKNITEEEKQELFDNFIEAAIALNNELSTKKIPNKREAYLSCLLNVGVIMDFHESLDEFLEKCGE